MCLAVLTSTVFGSEQPPKLNGTPRTGGRSPEQLPPIQQTLPSTYKNKLYIKVCSNMTLEELSPKNQINQFRPTHSHM